MRARGIFGEVLPEAGKEEEKWDPVGLGDQEGLVEEAEFGL